MGQAVLDARSVAPDVFLADFRFSDETVLRFLNGELHLIEFENDILGMVTEAINGPTGEKMQRVPYSERFLSYVNLDMMMLQVSPIFELFGLGSRTSAESFASVVQEAKIALFEVDGMGSVDAYDLKYGSEFGIQGFVLSALECGGLTLKHLFHSVDPAVEVASGKLLQLGPMAFNAKLAVAKETLAARKRDNRLFATRNQQTRALELRLAALEGGFCPGADC